MATLDEPANGPTTDPELNGLLRELLEEVQRILGSSFVGLYLEGSLANGDFDPASDVDFVGVTDQEVSDEVFSALQTLHEGLKATTTRWSPRLEGAYLSLPALRRHDLQHAYHLEIEWGVAERLKRIAHDETWNIHRYLLRERGIVLLGPAPNTLIDPVSPDDLRQAMASVLKGWATHVLAHPGELTHQEYQSYAVLSVCRILYTLAHGDIVSKAQAARWVKDHGGDRWSALIDRAWIGRQHPRLPTHSEDITQTLAFLSHALDLGERTQRPPRREPTLTSR